MHPIAQPRGLIAAACSFALTAFAIGGDSVRRYGAPTPGSGNIAPTIWVNAVPRPGDAGFKLRIEHSLGGTWAFPFYATREGDVTFSGLRFLVDRSTATYGGAYFMTGQGDGGGSGDVPLPLPNNVGLIGQPLFVQAFTLDDFAANPLGIAATTGLRLTPALPGELLIARSLAGAPDTQSVIQLGPNRVWPFDQTRFAEGRSVAFAQGGWVALALDPAQAKLRLYDADGATPAWRSDVTLPAEGTPTRVVVTPDESRAYVLHTGASGSQPPTTAYDMRPGASFGQVWPGAPIRLANVADPCAMVFTRASSTAYVAAHGALPATAGSVSWFDVEPGSNNFHQQIRRIDFPGREVTDIAIAVDDRTLYVPLIASGRPGELAMIDVATFTVIDVDAATPGVQNLGGERSRTRTPVPDVLNRVAVDPRGDEIYCGAVGAIVRVNVAPASPRFGRVTTTTDNIPANDLVGTIVASDAADFIYATTSLRVIELDTVRLWSPRGWQMLGAIDLAFR